jgi:hypothetical protein
MHPRWKQSVLMMLGCGMAFLLTGTQEGSSGGKSESDLELVEKVILARKEYQMSLEVLRAHYLKVGDLERAKWAEEELLAYHRSPKQAYRLELDLPPSTLKGTQNKPEANELYARALSYKGKGWGTGYVDNQRRAEILLQTLLTEYPESNRISDAAYQLGDIYENAPYKHYKRAAAYFERCFQWNPATQFDARLRAARIYDRYLQDRIRAAELYREIMTHETNAAWKQEAARRLQELSNK